MDGDVVIGVEGLGKRYRLGTGSGERYTALRDVLATSAKNLFRRGSRAAKSESKSDAFWALKDISFEVKRGEVLGVIGRNGAGKSTLLKVLSRITDPTEGKVRLRGRVASLLEVGTGFHPELTGRENIFLNGAILGMSRAEIKTKFDEIVAFSEVERFLDTPVKRYSSGMYVRLAFAVAAHLEPEILIVDEVLAVGDAEFQKKCLGKMGEVARGGRTVLFVSHNMDAVNRLCESGVLLEQGRVVYTGVCREVVAQYLSGGRNTSSFREWKDGARPGDDVVKLISVSATKRDGSTTQQFDIRQEIAISMTYEVAGRHRSARQQLQCFRRKRAPGFCDSRCKIPQLQSAPAPGDIHGDRLHSRKSDGGWKVWNRSRGHQAFSFQSTFSRGPSDLVACLRRGTGRLIPRFAQGRISWNHQTDAGVAKLTGMKLDLRALFSRRKKPPFFLAERYPQYKIGRWTYGNPSIQAAGPGATLEIGCFCSIADNVTILLQVEHRLDWISTYPFNVLWPNCESFHGHPHTKGDIKIGHDVWIGFGATILSGVNIGTGAVIGSQAVVTKNVEPYSIVAGNPARAIKSRFTETIVKRLVESGWWNLSDDVLLKLMPLLLSNYAEEFLSAIESV